MLSEKLNKVAAWVNLSTRSGVSGACGTEDPKKASGGCGTEDPKMVSGGCGTEDPK